MALTRNENGVSAEWNEDFKLWSWGDIDDKKITITTEVPYEIVEKISVDCAETITEQMVKDFRIEIGFGPDDLFIEAYPFGDLVNTVLRCDMTTILNDWIELHEDGEISGKVESGNAPAAERIAELLERAAAHIRAAIPD